jgi:hypothetical protein
LTGGIDGSISLWQFNAQSVESAFVATYRHAPAPRLNRIHFNTSGTKFAACDMEGKLAIWKFDANEASLKPFQTIQCNSKRTLDFTFMNSGSVLATSGISFDKKYVLLCSPTA